MTKVIKKDLKVGITFPKEGRSTHDDFRSDRELNSTRITITTFEKGIAQELSVDFYDQSLLDDNLLKIVKAALGL